MPELTWSSRPHAPDRDAVRQGLQHAFALRAQRLRRYGWHIAQCAVAAAVAWLLAREVLGHAMPFFAPVAAIVGLGLSYGQRLRRGLEVATGVALGVLIGDVFALLFGTGGWQVLVVVGTAMTVAVLLDASPLLITQAGTQSAIVTTLAPHASSGLGRWLDAVCGGLVALLAAAVVLGSPLRRPRLAAAGIARELTEQRAPERALTQLDDVARLSAQVPTGRSLSADVVLAQARSVVVDLMQVSGLAVDDADRRVRASDAVR